jgi:hypothetical protein
MPMMLRFWAEAYLKDNREPSRENGLEVNADKTKYMITSGDQNAGRSHNVETDNSSF